jgi:hypothetical protein
MTLVGRILRAIGRLFNGLRAELKRLVPIAVNIVQAIKTVMDGPVDDVILSIIEAAIPGNADDILIEKIKSTVTEWLPKILLELKLAESITGIDNLNDQLKAVLVQLKLSSDETQNIIYHGLCSLILEKLSDGKLSWSDSIAISEYYYKEILQHD